MVDMNFQKILDKLLEAHELFPDLNFCEIVQAAIDKDRAKSNVNLFDINSKKFHGAITSYINKTKKQRGME